MVELPEELAVLVLHGVGLPALPVGELEEEGELALVVPNVDVQDVPDLCAQLLEDEVRAAAGHRPVRHGCGVHLISVHVLALRVHEPLADLEQARALKEVLGEVVHVLDVLVLLEPLVRVRDAQHDVLPALVGVLGEELRRGRLLTWVPRLGRLQALEEESELLCKHGVEPERVRSIPVVKDGQVHEPLHGGGVGIRRLGPCLYYRCVDRRGGRAHEPQDVVPRHSRQRSEHRLARPRVAVKAR
mmetsp:Transcript_817/g.2297  ORF Transcript_817/g.2297 Transcript_817/m.2297 type:complete len:244 (-) Transcript_817:165-896(-)